MDALLTALRRRWPLALLAYVGIWTVPGLIATSQLAMSYSLRGDDPPLSLVAGLVFPGWYLWALLAPLVVLAALRWPLDGPRPWTLLPLHLGLNAVIGALWVGLVVASRRIFGLPGQTDLRLELVGGLGTSVLTYWAVVLVVHAVRFHQEGRVRALRAARLSAELSAARLAALQAQLQPHFLFNTMHAISADLRSRPDRAERMLAELADLLRHVLDASDEILVPLARELDFLDRFLGIQRMRLGERLRTEVTVEPDAEGWPVPSLLLQPLVENAIEHGIATRRSGGRLEIRARVRGDRLHLRVRDDGPGLNGGDGKPGGWRVGLGNTRDRLEHLYGPDHRLEVADHPDGGVEVRVEIPAVVPEAIA